MDLLAEKPVPSLLSKCFVRSYCIAVHTGGLGAATVRLPDPSAAVCIYKA